MEKTEQTEISPFAVQGVLAALKEVQDTVRAYDTSPVDPEAGTLFLPCDREAGCRPEAVWRPAPPDGGRGVWQRTTRRFGF